MRQSDRYKIKGTERLMFRQSKRHINRQPDKLIIRQTDNQVTTIISDRQKDRL